MKRKLLKAHMRTAYVYAEESHARRRRVGAIIVKDDRIISIGYNGTPGGWDNECEIEQDDGTLVTKVEVLHAESNAIAKLAGSTESGKGAALFVTTQPCMECAKMIYQSGITEVYYAEPYRLTHGIDFLKKCGVKVEHLEVDGLNPLGCIESIHDCQCDATAHTQ